MRYWSIGAIFEYAAPASCAIAWCAVPATTSNAKLVITNTPAIVFRTGPPPENQSVHDGSSIAFTPATNGETGFRQTVGKRHRLCHAERRSSSGALGMTNGLSSWPVAEVTTYLPPH